MMVSGMKDLIAIAMLNTISPEKQQVQDDQPEEFFPKLLLKETRVMVT